MGKNQLARLDKESVVKSVGATATVRSIKEGVTASFELVESPIMKIGTLPAEFLGNFQSQMRADSGRSHRYGHIDTDTPEGCYEEEVTEIGGKEEFNVDTSDENQDHSSLFEWRVDEKDVKPPVPARGINIDTGEDRDQESIFGRGRYADFLEQEQEETVV